MLVNNHFYVVHKDNALYIHKDSSDIIIMAMAYISVFYRDTVPKEYIIHMIFGMWPKI